MDEDIKKPKVTVLMSVYNGEKYLREAIDSILLQTFSDFEFLIIDDGSTDTSAEIIRSYTDARIRYIPNDKNMGLPYSLNRGLELAQGKYIARMDCDDVSLPERLKKQVGFMDTHSDISACGTWVKTFGNDREEIIHKYFTDPNDIQASLLFNTSLAHPIVLMRKSTLEEHNLKYNMNFKYFEEDYNLWVEISRCAKLANLPEVLLHYRLHDKSVTHLNAEARQAGISEIRRKQLDILGLMPTTENMRIHNSIYPRQDENAVQFLKKEEDWLKKIVATNKKTNIYRKESLSKIIHARWYLLCRSNMQHTGIFAFLKIFITYFLRK